jgi:protein TonB
VNIAPPPTPAPAITVVTQEAPPAPQAPVIAKVDPKPAPAPAVRSAQVICPNYREVTAAIDYPREALLGNIEGDVTVEFTVTASGQIRDPVIRQSAHRVFNRVALSAVQRLNCQSGGQDIRVQAPLTFKIR